MKFVQLDCQTKSHGRKFPFHVGKYLETVQYIWDKQSVQGCIYLVISVAFIPSFMEENNWDQQGLPLALPWYSSVELGYKRARKESIYYAL